MLLKAFNEPLELREIEIPQLDEGQVLVELQASGVCGSDIHMWSGEDPRTPLPIILGHEGVGTVVDIKGEKRTVDGCSVKPGDSIIWNRGITCGKCYSCTVLKEPSLCTSRRVYGISIPSTEKPYVNGCYSDYIVLRSNTDIFAIPSNTDPAVLVSASCSGATSAHAFDMIPGNLIGQTVVVQGAGPLGVYAVAFARRLGASHIFVFEGSDQRLKLCRKFGSTHPVNIHTTPVDERNAMVMDVTHGRGADLVMEAVGLQGVAEEGVRLLRKGGTYLSAGYAQPAGKESIDFYRDIVSRNIRIQGVWVSDTRHTRQALDLVLDDPDTFAGLITHRFNLEEANEALRVMKERQALKAVITKNTG